MQKSGHYPRQVIALGDRLPVPRLLAARTRRESAGWCEGMRLALRTLGLRHKLWTPAAASQQPQPLWTSVMHKMQ